MYTYDTNGNKVPYAQRLQGSPSMGYSKEHFIGTPSSSNWYWWVLVALVLIVLILMFIKYFRKPKPAVGFGYKFY